AEEQQAALLRHFSTEEQEAALELLQHKSKVDSKKQVPKPEWCLTLAPADQATIPACTGVHAEGSCGCMGAQVCGVAAVAHGSWQSYSSACCGCKAGGLPVLLQRASEVDSKKQVPKPEWCLTIAPADQATIPACTGVHAEGSCGCLGAQVCGTAAVAHGSWQSYSSACCGCQAGGLPLALEQLLLQHTSKAERAQVPKPAWCNTIDLGTQATIPACTGVSAEGGCTCMGAQVCGVAEVTQGSWQSYSSACCACHSGGLASAVVPVASHVASAALSAPLAVAAPLASVVAPVASAVVVPAAAAAAAAAVPLGSMSVPAWCWQMSPLDSAQVPACHGGAGGCMCEGVQVCGVGHPLPGSWQAYSSACCGCK
ncbi:unnamed protein product, partial [Polarella glacialis]